MRVLAPFLCVALLLCLSIKPVLAVETDDNSDLEKELLRTTTKFTQVVDVKEGSAPQPAPAPPSNSAHPPSLGSVQWDLDRRGGGAIWHGRMSFGEGSMYRVMPDTGSSLTVVNPAMYTPSAKARDTGKRFRVRYGGGVSSAGKIYEDDVHINGMTVRTTICRADVEYQNPSSLWNNNGIIGFGFVRNDSNPAAVPLLEDIFKAHTLQRNIVTFRLAKKDARATFGGLDPEMKGSVTYMPVRHHLTGYWDTTASVNGIGGSSTPAVLDTGATHTYVPLKMAEQIFTALNLTIVHSGSVSLGQYECSQAPPKITVRVGTFDIALSPRSTKLAREKSIMCFVNIIGGDVRPVDPFIIIGADVLSNVYVVLDRDGSRIGLSKRNMPADEYK